MRKAKDNIRGATGASVGAAKLDDEYTASVTKRTNELEKDLIM
jgi:hypothetical protein